ncbi:MAG TPA: PKD domain-containing protein, partial [Isosphaeraceae bacterium]
MEKRRRFRPRPDLLEGRRLLAVTPAGVAITATEDQLFVGLVATFTANDPSPQSEDNYSATIDWGDGRTSEGFVIADPDVPGQFGVGDEHTYAETGTYSVTVTINDLVDGTSSTINSTAVVIAPPPLTATSRTVNPTEGTPLTDVVTTFTDAAPNGTAGDYSATIDWGDGHTTYGTITGNPRGGFNVTGTNTYADPGPYPVNVVIRSDRDGRVASADSLAVVADAPLLAVPAAVVANEGEPLDGAILATFT